ncbi:MAG: hypothetical protein LBE08_11305 [Bifidobacteriaceae bacterium]|nr:hypothetical protein [Bifidobacteriaceae bacterium]
MRRSIGKSERRLGPASGRRWLRPLALACGFALILAAAWGSQAPAADAAATQLVLTVNTTAAGTEQDDIVDGRCATGAGDCSLRAAIAHSNATTGDTEVLINVQPGLTGTISMSDSRSAWMTTENATGVDRGAYFYVTRPVTIDLDNRLGVKATTDDSAAAFWIEAKGTKLLNFSGILPGETGIVFGVESDGSVLDGGTTMQVDDYNAERIVWIKGGADGITVKNYTVGRLYDADHSGAIVMRSTNSQPESVIERTTISNVTVDNQPVSSSCSYLNGGGCASAGLAISNATVNGLTLEDSTFAHSAGITIESSTVNDWVVSNSTFTDASEITCKGDAITRLTVTESRFSGSSGIDLAGSGSLQSNWAHFEDVKVVNSDFESSSGLRVRRAYFTGLEVVGSRFTGYASGSRVIDVSDDIGASPQLDIRGNTFKDAAIGSSDSSALILLPKGETMGLTSYVRQNVFDNSGSGLTQGYAIYYDGGASSRDNTTPSNLFIEDNYFDGYTKLGVSLDDTGIVTVRRNTFGVNHANAASSNTAATAKEETSESGDASMFQNYGRSSNRKVLTWYPTGADVVGDCQLAVDLLRQASGTAPKEPVTIDFYYTAGTTAEEYLGSVDNVTPDQAGRSNVIVPDLPSSAKGYLRVQTHGIYPGGQSESSQYSRTILLPEAELAACSVSSLEIELRAWRGVGADTSHDGIVGGGAAEIEANSSLLPGETVWFTYTVTNNGKSTLRQVAVTDAFAAPVCTIAQLRPGQTSGCSQSRAVPT